MRHRVTVMLILLTAACESGGTGGGDAGESTESTGGETDACAILSGHTYQSVEELECGVGPMGPEMCQWTIEFSDGGNFTWYLSDYQEAGSYYCNGLDVIGNGSMSYQGSLDPDTGVLGWDGHDYAQLAG